MKFSFKNVSYKRKKKRFDKMNISTIAHYKTENSHFYKISFQTFILLISGSVFKND